MAIVSEAPGHSCPCLLCTCNLRGSGEYFYRARHILSCNKRTSILMASSLDCTAASVSADINLYGVWRLLQYRHSHGQPPRTPFHRLSDKGSFFCQSFPLRNYGSNRNASWDDRVFVLGSPQVEQPRQQLSTWNGQCSSEGDPASRDSPPLCNLMLLVLRSVHFHDSDTVARGGGGPLWKGQTMSCPYLQSASKVDAQRHATPATPRSEVHMGKFGRA